METQDRKAFASLIVALCEVYNRDVSPEFTEIYFRALEDDAIDDIERAVWECIKTMVFFPKPVEILSLTKRYRQDRRDWQEALRRQDEAREYEKIVASQCEEIRLDEERWKQSLTDGHPPPQEVLALMHSTTAKLAMPQPKEWVPKTEAELEARKALLRQQAEELMKREQEERQQKGQP